MPLKKSTLKSDFILYYVLILITLALYATSKFLYNELDNNKKIIAVFLDLAKAFDMINNDELLKMLPSVGIYSESFMWFKAI